MKEIDVESVIADLSHCDPEVLKIIQEVVDELNLTDFNIHEIRENSLFRIDTDSTSWFLKIRDSLSRNWIAQIFSRVKLQHEITVSRQVNVQQPQMVQAPRIFKTDNHRYILFEFIPKSRPSDPLQIARSLVEFQNSGLQVRPHILLRIWYNDAVILLRSLMNCIKSRLLTWHEAARIVYVWSTLAASQPKLDFQFLSHGDFHQGNTMVNQDGNLMFLDFECTVFVKKWAFTDIVRFSRLHVTTGFIDNEVVSSYIEEFKARYPERFNQLSVGIQIRLALIRKLVRQLCSGKRGCTKQEMKEFLNGTLLDDDKYESWFDEHVGFEYRES
ncbi:MAG: aminoglycoside phosphotransferase family protein [Balneolaceae bacterium]